MKLFREFVRNPEQLLTGNFYDDLERVTAAREVVTDKLVKNAVATYGTVGLVLGGVATGLAWVGTGSALTTLVTGGAAFAIVGGSAVVGLGIAKLALYIRGKLLEAKAARLHK